MNDLSRLRWRCRRGMRELDTLLSAFLEQAWAELTVEERRRFEALLALQDAELYAWVLGRERPEDPGMAALVERIVAQRGV